MSERTLEYQPALDGVRALAVAMVLMFHHGFTWMSGGYMGVSVFFTLSGYLITSLLLVEQRDRGTIDLGRFYARRARRLLPAGLLCLALVIVARLLGEFDRVPNLRRDLLGSLFQVQNWVKLFGPASYTELLNLSTGDRGPLEHYWSLAIEEQFYWLWPLALLLVFRAIPSWRARRLAIDASAAVACALAPIIAAVWGPDAAYWATPARAGEILVGAALAAWLRGRPSEDVIALRRPLPWLAVGGAATVVVVGVTWPAADGPAYAGALPLFAFASAALVLGLHAPSIVRSLFSMRPAVWLGRISYGVYLYHWPVFVILGDHRTGVDGPRLFLLRLAVTLAIATVSYWLVERPIRDVRRHRIVWSRGTASVAFTGSAAVAAAAVLLIPDATREFYAPDAVHAAEVALRPVDSLSPLGTLAPGTSRVLSTSLPRPSRPVRILVVGDSTAEATGTGLIEWAARHPEWAQVSVAASSGCGVIRDSEIDEDLPFQVSCDRLLDEQLPLVLADLLPDVVVLMVTMRDLEDRTWDDAEGVLTPFDRRYGQRLVADQLTMVDTLRQAGVGDVVWILPPRPIAPFVGERRKMSDPARYRVQEEAIEEVVRRRPDLVTVVDLASWMDEHDMTVDVVRRPDGVHFSRDAALEITDRILASSILSAVLFPS